MDPPVNALKYEDNIVYPVFGEPPPPSLFNENALYHNFTPFSLPILDPANVLTSSSKVPEVESTDADDSDSDPVLKLINQILLDETPTIFVDPLALQAAEKSWYDVLSDNKYPSSTYHQNQKADNPNSLLVNSSQHILTNISTVDRSFTGQSYARFLPNHDSEFGYKNVRAGNDSILQFKKGMEEASKFLPSTNQFVIDLDKYNLPSKLENDSGSRRTKHLHNHESKLEEERNSKQSAVYVEEVELTEMFDRVLLLTDANVKSTYNCNGQVSQNQNHSRTHKSEAFDLRNLLINCAQSVAAGDLRSANEQLKQLKKYSSVTGDACQRLASVFANGLEARLAGNGFQNHVPSKFWHFSALEKIKVFQVYLSACPFKMISIFFANNMILHIASKATTLHIVDFGIHNGFQWPLLIQHLSNLPDGPPRLRITGIEHPQPGFKPQENLEKTGRRLAQYCERFHVPFEYQSIASQNWETITFEDLKIVEGETLAVNNIHRFKNLLDETIMANNDNNPRDTVLKLIKKMNPDIFVNSIENGAYNAPFFLTRFREALFHFSSLFDMLDAIFPREDECRLIFEQEFYGRYAMDVISCEGAKRIERPETYKQWRVRLKRAGFKPLPLNKEIINKLRLKVKAGYHKDFDFDEDSSWMLLGWKGRIIYASSCWVLA